MRTSPPAPRSSGRQALYTIHALILDKSTDGHDAIGDIARDEHMDWLQMARIDGVSLVVLSLPDALELYAVGAERTRAFRIVLRALQEHLRALPRYRELRTAELIGSAAVNRLFCRAAGLVSTRSPGDAAATILTAATVSLEVGSLGSRLAPLFWAAGTVQHRVTCETNFDPRGFGESDDVERLAAERIVEEELASFRSRQAEAANVRWQSSRPPGFNKRSFELHERASLLRVRLSRRRRKERIA